jgi:hypothetical protein
VLAESIREARNDRPCDQSDCGSSRQHRTNFRRPKPTLMEQRGQEWGRDPEGGEQGAIEK